MNTLTKDDLYEIEKVLDAQAGVITHTLNALCNTAIHYAVKEHKCPLDDNILELKKAYDRIKDIRDKLQTMRLAE